MKIKVENGRLIVIGIHEVYGCDKIMLDVDIKEFIEAIKPYLLEELK